MATTILSSEAYLSDAGGMVLSADSKRLFVVNDAGHSIRIFDSGTGALLTDLAIEGSPASLISISPTRFMLYGVTSTNGPLLFLDTTEPARVLFVPRGE
jgi:hypothetical protein